VIGGVLLIMGMLVAVMGVLADLIAANRKLVEVALTKLREMEDALAEPQFRKAEMNTPADRKNAA
jgi:hypothetical protein